MRRGLKAWCERTALEYREALGVSPRERLDPRRLAAELGVKVLAPAELPDLSDASRTQLLKAEPYAWSAVTVRSGDASLIVVNPAHSPARQANNLAHELAHLILNHPPDEAVAVGAGLLFRTYDPDKEDEADWLAGCLLAPREGLLAIRARNPSVEAIARHFGVSLDLIRWRLEVTGVTRQLRAARRR